MTEAQTAAATPFPGPCFRTISICWQIFPHPANSSFSIKAVLSMDKVFSGSSWWKQVILITLFNAFKNYFFYQITSGGLCWIVTPTLQRLCTTQAGSSALSKRHSVQLLLG